MEAQRERCWERRAYPHEARLAGMARLVILGRLAAAAASTSRAAAWVPTTTGLGCNTGAWRGRFALQGAWWSSGVSGGVEGYSDEMLASLDELKIKELDAELKRVGLLLSGRKADKVERLSRFIRSQEGASAGMTHKDAELAGVQVVRSRKAESRRRTKGESRRASGSRHKRDGAVEGKGKTDTSLADLVWADQALHINRRTDVAVEMERRRRNERKGAGIPRDVDAGLTHTDARGNFRMVDVTSKRKTPREAMAYAEVKLTSPSVFSKVENQSLTKGDLFASMTFSGILAAKKAADLISGCHPIPLDFVRVHHVLDVRHRIVRILATVRARWHTGPEMEARIAATGAANCCIDHVKSEDQDAEIRRVILLRKKGGKSGEYLNKRAVASGEYDTIMRAFDKEYPGDYSASSGEPTEQGNQGASASLVE